MTSRGRWMAAASAGAAAAVVWLAGAGQPPAGGGGPPESPKAAQPGGEAGGMANMSKALVEGLRATPGCLGVELARTQSGKLVIFAWFESKKATLAWYRSAGHQRVMERFFPGHEPSRPPMADVPEDAGPILTVASLKLAEQPLPGTQAPVSEISIELYTPLPGGVRLNGGFAPAGLKVPGMQDLKTEAPGEGRPPGRADGDGEEKR